MEKLKIRKNAYIEGSKAGFFVGVFATIAAALMIQKTRRGFDNRYPFSTPK